MTGDRAVSTTVGYVITLSITTLLVSGLLIAGGDFVQDQRQSASLSELRVVGQQLATDIAAADRLSQTSGPDGDLVLERELPEQIAGSNYRIHTSRVGDRDTYEIRMEASNPDVSTDVRVYSTTPVFMKTNLTGGSTAVEYNSVTETLLVKRPDPYVFQEESGRVVIEAETYPEDQVGTENTSTHYWKSFEDTDASGDEAVIVKPNETVNTHDDLYGPRMEYEVNFENPGQYHVWVRTKSENGNEDSVHVALNEDGSWEPATFGGLGLGDSNTGDGNWDWSNEISSSGGTAAKFTVDNSGTHTVAVWMREDNTRIDKIVLTKNNPPTFDTGSDDDDTGPPESDWG